MCALACLTAPAAFTQVDPYAAIGFAVKQTLAEPQVYVGISGFMTFGSTQETYLARLYIKGNAFALDAFVNDERRLLVIADGTKVWRYDPVRNEYTYLKQPETLDKAFEVAASFSRAELQKPLRLLAGSARWLVKPQAQSDPEHVRLWETQPFGQGDWRGADSNFDFDRPSGKMEWFTYEEKRNIPQIGLRHVAIRGDFIYDRPFTNVTFTFTPPPGSKPAADLPVRIDG